MRNMSSFINKNYDSPNIKDIKKVVRRREIEELFSKEKRNEKMTQPKLAKVNTD